MNPQTTMKERIPACSSFVIICSCPDFAVDPSASRKFGSGTWMCRTAFPFGSSGDVYVTPSVPLAANSVTQYLRTALWDLRDGLTKRDHRDELSEAIKWVTKAVGPGLYTDEGHLNPVHGSKVFNFDKEAVRTLFELLRRNDLPTAMIAPLSSVAESLAGTAHELAYTAIYYSDVPDSLDRSRAITLLQEGETDWTSPHGSQPEIEAFDDFRQAWRLVAR